MPTWSGWIIEFLQRAGILNTPPVQRFMSQWAAHAPGSCRNNPVDLTKAVPGSSRCGATVGGFGRSQNYSTHAQAATAFREQVRTDWVRPLLDALNTGNPFDISNRDPVVKVLERWGSPQFAAWYQAANSDGTTGGSRSGGVAPQTHRAWSDLQRSVDKRLPKALHAAEKASLAALRAAARARKVRH